MRRSLLLKLACALAITAALPASARADAPAKSPTAAEEHAADVAWADPALVARVKESGRLVIHVYVPLCDNDQIDCGSDKAGQPKNLDHNLYWGAVFGHKRFFSRKASAFERVAVTSGKAPLLERAVFERSLPGQPWGRTDDIALVVVFDAYDGAAIDQALRRFFREAERGGKVLLGEDGEVSVDVVGYAGHNRMMDGTSPPERDDKKRAPIPSFVMACRSKSYFADPLAERGSRGLLFTRDLMAPEGYVLEALVTSLGENRSPLEVRRRVVGAYATFQRITEAVAGRIFAPV